MACRCGQCEIMRGEWVWVGEYQVKYCPNCGEQSLINKVTKSVFLICPVRRTNTKVQESIEQIIETAALSGISVYWPYQDTDQTGNGTSICEQNRQAIIDADEVWIWYDPDSQGSLFDLGIAWGLGKKLWIVNEVETTPEKSFANVLVDWNDKSRT